MKNMFTALGNYSTQGLLLRRTAKKRAVYLIMWTLTGLTCYLFYALVLLFALAGTIVLFSLISAICQL